MPYTIHHTQIYNTQFTIFCICIEWLLKPLNVWIRRVQMISLLYKWVVGGKANHVGFLKCSCNSRVVTQKSLHSRLRVNQSRTLVTLSYKLWLVSIAKQLTSKSLPRQSQVVHIVLMKVFDKCLLVVSQLCVSLKLVIRNHKMSLWPL